MQDFIVYGVLFFNAKTINGTIFLREKIDYSGRTPFRMIFTIDPGAISSHRTSVSSFKPMFAKLWALYLPLSYRISP